jgi:hypothetical protein
MVVLSIVTSWYPFALDLPRRVVNSAVQRPDGAWDVDTNSRLISHAPDSVAAMLSAKRFSMTVEAMPTVADQTGPARLVSIGRSPYDPALMIGIDHDSVVLYLPCDGAAPDLDVDWQVPFNSERGGAVSVSLWFDRSNTGPVVSMQVNDQKRMQLDNHCPPGASPGLPKATLPWALGNVASGHRPFVGRIGKLEMTQDGRNVDLLRAMPWHAPSTFWMLPERFFERSNNTTEELVAALWHFASFAVMGYLLAGIARQRRTSQLAAALLVFAAILNGGKVLIASRHPAAIDLVLNVAGAMSLLYLRRRFMDADGSVAHQSEPGHSAPRS